MQENRVASRSPPVLMSLLLIASGWVVSRIAQGVSAPYPNESTNGVARLVVLI